MVLEKHLYNATPPDATTKADNNAALLMSWWCTLFALTGIIIRLIGRYVRTEKLFREDKIMALSIIPLLIRMAFVHVVMIWGTNNAKTQHLSEISIHHREIGSRLVLISRIFYAAFIWTAKYTVSEFLKRIIGSHWRRSYEYGLQGIRYFLGVTFIAVVIATIGECQPFDHYWQVVPDPGPKCREGLAQLITMGVCDIITDVLLVIYPIPIVIASAMPLKRKFSLSFLFMFSLGLVAITAYRIPAVVSRKGAQEFRTLIASLEILAAAAVSNAIIIGSFIRDRGAKKAKWKFGSTDGTSIERTPTRATTITMHHWGSDADLVSELGIGLHPKFRSKDKALPRPAPIAEPFPQDRTQDGAKVNKNWGFPQQEYPSMDSDTSVAMEAKLALDEGDVSPGAIPGDTVGPTNGPRKLSFFDIGGLLGTNSPQTDEIRSRRTSRSQDSVNTRDFAAAAANRSFPQLQQINGRRQSSSVFFADVGGLLSAHPEQPEPPESQPFLRNGRITRMPSGSSPESSARPERRPVVAEDDLLDDDDVVEDVRRTSRGGTSSLIAALATSPPGLPNGPNAFPSHGDPNGRGHPRDGPELMDPGGLLG